MAATSGLEDVLIDPICGMTVNTSPCYGNKVYHFCSDHCLEAFKAEPEVYGRIVSRMTLKNYVVTTFQVHMKQTDTISNPRNVVAYAKNSTSVICRQRQECQLPRFCI